MKPSITQDAYNAAIALLQIERDITRTHFEYAKKGLQLEFEGCLNHVLRKALRTLGVEDRADYLLCYEKWFEALDSGVEFTSFDYANWVLAQATRRKSSRLH